MTTKYLNLDIDSTLGGGSASDSTISSQKAIKSYVDNKTSGMVKKVNNTSPDANGNVTLTIPTTTSSVTSGSTAALTSGGAYTNLVTKVEAGTTANIIKVTKAGTASSITINNVAHATSADSATSATSADSATTASKLGSTTLGSTTQPIYLDAGTPKTISYTIAKSVPADAKFTDTTYSNFVKSGSTAAAGLVPSPGTTAGTTKFLREDATWVVPTDTKNTAGGDNTSSKIFLVGMTAQTTNNGTNRTYSHDTAFVDANGRLNSAAPASDANDTTVATTKWVKDQNYLTSGLQAGDNVSELVNDAGYLTSVSWSDVQSKPTTFTPSAHNQASNTINAMTGYSKATSVSAIGTSDTLNGAIGKLEKALDGKQASGSYISYANNSAVVVGNTKTVAKTSPTTIYVENGLIMGGSAQAAGLVTRGICGSSTPDTKGACTKDNLYLNYDGSNTYSASRHIILQAGEAGTHYGNNLYQYAAARGDAVKGYADATYAPKTHSHDYVPTSRTVNGKALSSNITLSASDVGALSSDITLATVATSGSYTDLSNKPTIPTVTDTYSATSSNAMSGKAVASAISGKANSATTLSGYGITDAYTKTQVDGMISSVYKPAGSVAFASLPTLAAGVLGNVYNVTDAFTTTTNFVEGAGKTYPANTNVVVVNVGTSASPSYKFDVLSGFVDLSGYVPTSRTVNGKALSANISLTAADVGALSSDITLATVATSGSYTDLSNKPTIPTTTSSVTSGSTAALTSGGAYTNLVTKVEAGTTANIIKVTKAGTASSITINNVAHATSADSATSATTATKLGSTTLGSTTQPIYLDAGTPKTISYTIAKSVPADAKFTDTTYSVFTGANGSAAGTSGLVKAPAATDNTKFLKGDGTWATPANTTYSNGTGITIGSGNAINHSNSVTAGTAGTSTATSGSTLAVPYVTYDAQGHITATGTHTHTVSGFVPTSRTVNGKALSANISLTAADVGALSSSTTINDLTSSAQQNALNSGITSSTKVTHTADTAVGGTTQPVYISSTGVATAISYTIAKSVPSDAVFTDTKNTAGSTDTSSKIFLVGATSQAANPQTYSHDTVFVDTEGALNSATPAAGNNTTKVATTAFVTTALGSYLAKSGGTMTGAITFANNTWNSMGDDASIGDHNVGGHICIKPNQSTHDSSGGISFHNSSGTALVQLNASSNTLTSSGALGVSNNAAKMQYNSTTEAIEFVFA